MGVNTIQESELLYVIIYTLIAFMLMILVLVIFYFSRKKIIQKELEKLDLDLQYQKELLQAMILSQEAERKRIAHDLHDDISSKLNIVSLNSHMLSMANVTKEDVVKITSNIISYTAKALESSRRIAHDLLPPTLDNFGLHNGVEELCMEVESRGNVTVNYINKVQFDNLEKERHVHVFRILQELMNNSMHHGKATSISILFEENSGMNSCSYTDNGCGFEINDKKNKKGLGMKNIESRVAFLNGKITLSSAINQGIYVNFNF